METQQLKCTTTQKNVSINSGRNCEDVQHWKLEFHTPCWNIGDTRFADSFRQSFFSTTYSSTITIVVQHLSSAFHWSPFRSQFQSTTYTNSCFGEKLHSLRVTTDSEIVFREESIWRGFQNRIPPFQIKMVRLWRQFKCSYNISKLNNNCRSTLFASKILATSCWKTNCFWIIDLTRQAFRRKNRDYD